MANTPVAKSTAGPSPACAPGAARVVAPTLFPTLLVACCAAALFGFTAGCLKCERSGNYNLGAYSESLAHGGDINWNGRTSYFGDGGPAFVIVSIPQGALPTAPMVEIYRGSERLEVPETIQRGVVREDCFADEVTYDVRTLEDGEYALVHRLSSAPDGLPPVEGLRDEVTSFEREPALVTTLVVETPTGPLRPGDAGP